MSDETLLFEAKWPGSWRSPELWRALVNSQGREVDPGALPAVLLGDVAYPPSPLDIFEGLMNDGAFDAAAKLLSHDPFIAVAGDDLQSRAPLLALDLEEQRMKARGEVLGRIDLLLARSREAKGSLSPDHPSLQKALFWSHRDSREAKRELRVAEDLVDGDEARRVEELHGQIERVLRSAGQAPRVEEWRDAVERLLRQHLLAQAEVLIDAGPARTNLSSDLVLPKPLDDDELTKHDAAVVCTWMLGEALPPEDLSQHLAVGSWGDVGDTLIRAVQRVCVSEPTEADVAELATRIESLLGVSGERDRIVGRDGHRFKTTLDGLQDAACPLFIGEPVPFFVEPEALHDQIPSPTFPAVVLRVAGRAESMTDRAVITPCDLLRCLLRPADFRFNLMRILCGRLRRRHLIPPHERSPSTWMTFPRRDDRDMFIDRLRRGNQIVFGAVGAGKTAFLSSVLATLQTEGSNCVYLSAQPGLPSAARPFAPGTVVALDDGHELSAHELEVFLAQASVAGARARVIICGRPTVRSRVPQSLVASDARFHLPLLSFSALRAFAERVLDVSGYSASPHLLDVIASYSAGRPAILYALLRSLFLELDEGFVLPGAPVEVRRLEAAYYRPEFRRAVRAIILDPVEADSVLNVVLAAFLMEIDRHPSGTTTTADVRRWLDIESIELAEDEFQAAIDDLRDLEIIEKDPRTTEVTLSRSSGSMLLFLIPTDLQQYFADAKARFAGQVRRRLGEGQIPLPPLRPWNPTA